MSDAFVGEIRLVPYYRTFPPKGWMFCDGTKLSISKFQVLYALIGTTYGGDGVNDFALPDLRGRVLVCQGTGNGQTPRNMGQTGGSEGVVLKLPEIPLHNHKFLVSTQGNTSKNPAGMFYGSDTSSTYKRYLSPVPTNPAPTYLELDETTIQPAGSNGAHENLMAGLSLHYIICTTAGLFPERN